jgi:hypothetical protein
LGLVFAEAAWKATTAKSMLQYWNLCSTISFLSHQRCIPLSIECLYSTWTCRTWKILCKNLIACGCSKQDFITCAFAARIGVSDPAFCSCVRNEIEDVKHKIQECHFLRSILRISIWWSAAYTCRKIYSSEDATAIQAALFLWVDIYLF